jgi:hypothetical protein
MNEEPQIAERSPTYEVVQRAPMLFAEHLGNIGVLHGFGRFYYLSHFRSFLKLRKVVGLKK